MLRVAPCLIGIHFRWRHAQCDHAKSGRTPIKAMLEAIPRGIVLEGPTSPAGQTTLEVAPSLTGYYPRLPRPNRIQSGAGPSLSGPILGRVALA
eukprot:6855471-Pyramimonas_sp.AAC.1